MKRKISTLLFLFISCTLFSQVREVRISCGIMPNYKRSILKKKLNVAQTMSDLNSGYPSTWISRHISAEIEATCNGKTIKAVSPNDTLSAKQKSILASADLGTDVIVRVKYNPLNSLYTADDVREIGFEYTVVPPVEAQYSEGKDVLVNYLSKQTVDEIPKAVYNQLENATVTFTINKHGQVTNAHITEPSNIDNIDDLLLKAICNMPDWVPAESSEGEKVEQEFKFSVGYLIGC